eukprot:4275886-Pyramimonas_sp.AAC.1
MASRRKPGDRGGWEQPFFPPSTDGRDGKGFSPAACPFWGAVPRGPTGSWPLPLRGSSPLCPSAPPFGWAEGGGGPSS